MVQYLLELRVDSISFIQGKWPRRPFFLLTIVWCLGGKEALLGHTLKILTFYPVALTLNPAYVVYKDLKEDMEWEDLPALFCIFYKFICHIRLSVFWNWKILLLKHNWSIEYFVLLMTEKSELLHQSSLVDWIWMV